MGGMYSIVEFSLAGVIDDDITNGQLFLMMHVVPKHSDMEC